MKYMCSVALHCTSNTLEVHSSLVWDVSILYSKRTPLLNVAHYLLPTPQSRILWRAFRCLGKILSIPLKTWTQIFAPPLSLQTPTITNNNAQLRKNVHNLQIPYGMVTEVNSDQFGTNKINAEIVLTVRPVR